jgi:hypothetical protein
MIATKKEQPMGWIVLDKGNLTFWHMHPSVHS